MHLHEENDEIDRHEGTMSDTPVPVENSTGSQYKGDRLGAMLNNTHGQSAPYVQLVHQILTHHCYIGIQVE